MSRSCWRDVLLADLAIMAARADHDEFARNHLLRLPPADGTPVVTMTALRRRPAAGGAREGGSAAAGPRSRGGGARGSAQRAAVIMLVLAVIFQPVLHPTGPGNSSPVDLLIVAAIVTALVWLAGTHRKLRAPYFIPVALFVAAGAASGLVSPLPTTALTTVMIDILLFAWCTTVVNVLSVPRAMRCALAAWSWSGIFWAAVFIAAWAGHVHAARRDNPAEGNRLAFTFGDPNYASWYWDATIFVVYRRAHSRQAVDEVHRLRHAGVGAGADRIQRRRARARSRHRIPADGQVLPAAWLGRGQSRPGWSIGLAVGAFFTAVPLNSIRQWALDSGQPLLVNSIGRSAQSSSERSLLIQETIELYQRSDGVLGLGPMSTKPLLAQWYYPYSNEAHDDFLAALCERGVLGLLALLLLAGSVVARAGPALRRTLSAPMAAAVPASRRASWPPCWRLGVNSVYEEVLHFRPAVAAVRDHCRASAGTRGRCIAGGSAGSRGCARLRHGELATRRRQAPADRRVVPPRPPPSAGCRGESRRVAAARRSSGQVISNLGAQCGALACVSVASLLVARIGGPTVLGYYALLRVLPWLFGVMISCGLPTAAAYFLAGEHGEDRRSRPTIALMAVSAPDSARWSGWPAPSRSITCSSGRCRSGSCWP